MVFSVDQLVADCAAAVQDSDGHSAVAVEEVLTRAISNPAAIEAAIGHPRDQPVFSTRFNLRRADRFTCGVACGCPIFGRGR